MLPGYVKKSNIGIGLAFLAWVVGICFAAGTNSQFLASIGIIIAVTGTGIWIWACCCYAMAKGYSGVVGMLAVLGILGLIILLVLHDNTASVPAAPPAEESKAA